MNLDGLCIQKHSKMPSCVFSGNQNEQTGLVIRNNQTQNLQFRRCYTSRGGTHSAEPFCAGRRRCFNHNNELNTSDRVVAEWHTHPDVGFSPPSGSDMYQLIVAHLVHKIHNKCIVFAREGTYIASICTSSAKQKIERELRRFFNRERHGLNKCREPIITNRNCRSYPYLNRLLHGTQHVWSLLRRREYSINHKIRLYGKYLKDVLHIRLRFLLRRKPG